MKPTTRNVLLALKAAGSTGATTHDLGQADVGGFRFGGRIYELRHVHGYEIREEREGNGSRYWLELNRDPAKCPAAVCDRGCGTDCTCPECACPRCVARRLAAAQSRLRGDDQKPPIPEQLSLEDVA